MDEKTLIEALASIPGWELTEDEIEGLAAKRGIIVCSTWPDSTKPHGFHYEVLRGYELLRNSDPGNRSVNRVHCKSYDDAIRTKNMVFGPEET
jgi:hypothetical protein